MCVHMCVLTRAMSRGSSVEVRTTTKGQFSPSILRVPRNKLKLSGLAARAFAR